MSRSATKSRKKSWQPGSGKTQLLDMALHSDNQVQEMVEAFKASHGKYVSKAMPPVHHAEKALSEN